jgi:hypothetical protein
MKRLLSKLFLLILFLFGTLFAIAANPDPPSPTGRHVDGHRRGRPPPPGLSIDDNIFILFSVAILLGIYIIYKYNLKTKNPI